MLILSLGTKPEPLTFKVVPGGPLERSKLKSAPKVKVIAGTSPLEVSKPEARTVCGPAGREGTDSDVDHDPFRPADTPVATVV